MPCKSTSSWLHRPALPLRGRAHCSGPPNCRARRNDASVCYLVFSSYVFSSAL
ncbi:hypothetical protein N9L68_03550 [bacterium]|nr:hypothetical protein [bacterium]